MQAGFAMVEAGFTRAKNTGNIIMKNLMDFCIGTVVFILIGFSLLMGEDALGLIGKPGYDLFTSYADFDFSSFVFNLVFCATIVGAVAGVLVVFGVWLLDHKLHIDDPVGAVAVHCLNGIWGTLAVGLFATNAAPGYSIANASGEAITGLFYGGGFELLGLQLLAKCL